MGKTSTALHVLHHPDVVDRYNDHRYFVGCDAVSSAETLATLILRIIGAPPTAGENIVTFLHRVLLSAPLTLLLLDNFETMWDIDFGRDGVIDLLQKIVNAKSVSLMITMRATVPPFGITWTRFDCLPQLSPPDAKQIFLAINPSWDDVDHRDEECLDKLLAEMDYVPLAVRLLAQVSIGFSHAYMLRWWKKEKTAMLRIHEGTPGKLESVEVSISLSLAAVDIKNNPETLQLLSMLCQLPDGLHQWEERLPIISTGLQNIYHLVHLLRKTALIFITGSSLKVLSPIRYFINRHYIADSDRTCELENYFWDLVHTYATVRLGPDFPRAKEVLEPDMGNIQSLIRNAAQIHPSPVLVDVILEVSQFQYFTVPSTELLRDVMPLVKYILSPIQEAQMLQSLCKILFEQSKNVEATNILMEAQRQFIHIGDILGMAQCSQRLGNILYMQGKYIEASEILTKAQKQFVDIGNVLGAAQCSRSLVDILSVQEKSTEASETLTKTQKQFVDIGDVLGVVQCSQRLGDILCMQEKYTEASEILTETRQQFLGISDVRGAVQCSRRLGNIFYMRRKYTEAFETLKEARQQSLDIGDVHGAARCSQSLGNILHMQHKYTEAYGILSEAQTQFINIGNIFNDAYCSRSLGRILHQQAKYPEASRTLTEARRKFLEIGSTADAADCSEILDDIIHRQRLSVE
jgi:tetratricopeptide (TPR) repeat protein